MLDVFTGRATEDDNRTPHVDNLVYGAPYQQLVPSFMRSGWSGASDIGDSFVALLRQSQKQPTRPHGLAQGQKSRYYDLEHRRAARRYSDVLMLPVTAGIMPSRWCLKHLPAWHNMHGTVASLAPTLRMLQLCAQVSPELLLPLCRRIEASLEEADVLDEQAHPAELVSLVDAAAAQTSRLSQHTREHPYDVTAWLQYVAHQQDSVDVAGAHVLVDVSGLQFFTPTPPGIA
jgi:hypothetical protein